MERTKLHSARAKSDSVRWFVAVLAKKPAMDEESGPRSSKRVDVVLKELDFVSLQDMR
jgi:hypothetical protein